MTYDKWYREAKERNEAMSFVPPGTVGDARKRMEERYHPGDIPIIEELTQACETMYSILRFQLEEDGGCDHSVGICACSVINVVDKAADVIAKVRGGSIAKNKTT